MLMKKLFAIAVLACMMLAGCEKGGENGEIVPAIKLSSENAVVAIDEAGLSAVISALAEGATVKIDVESNVAWSIIPPPAESEWITTNVSETGVEFVIAANESVAAREFGYEIASTGSDVKATITVKQAGVPSESVIYAVGQDAVTDKGIYYAAVWRNGAESLLTDGSHDGFCNSVCADDKNNIYVVGCEAVGDLIDDGYYEPYNQNVGILWKFNDKNPAQVERTVLSDGKNATSPIAVAVSNGNVHIAGFDTPVYDRRVIYWKNGEMQYLTDGTTDALAYCIWVDGDDVYIGGYIQPADNKQGGVATIWKNGVAQSLTDGSTVAKVNALYMDNGTLYAAGSEKPSGGRWKGVLWANGERITDFTGYVGTEVTGLYVKNGDYIIEGNMTETGSATNICPYIWTKEGAQKISSEVSTCQGTALAVDGDDIYVAGSEYSMDMSTFEESYKSYVWKNKEPQTLETKSNDNIIWAMTIAHISK